MSNIENPTDHPNPDEHSSASFETSTDYELSRDARRLELDIKDGRMEGCLQERLVGLAIGHLVEVDDYDDIDDPVKPITYY